MRIFCSVSATAWPMGAALRPCSRRSAIMHAFGSMPLEGYADPVKSLGAKIAQGNPVLQHTAVGKHPRDAPIGVELQEEHVAEALVAGCERMVPWLALHIAAVAKHLVAPGPAGPLPRHQHAVLHAQFAHHFRGHE